MEFNKRQSTLTDAIRENARKGAKGAAAVVEVLGKVREGAGEFKDGVDQQVELALRDVLLELRDEPGVNMVDKEEFPFPQLLDLAFALCLHEKGIRAMRAPFLLMEAVFETATPKQITELWSVVEQREGSIDKVFPKGGTHRLLLLKVCNGVLKRLSRKLHSSVTGRIDQFMSRVWSLSEPSAINKAGNANVDNVTLFMDEEEFEKQQEADRAKAAEESKAATKDTDDGKIKDGQAIDFSQYKHFWSLQKYLADPKATVDKDWDDFTKEAEVVMTSLEGYSLSEHKDGAEPARKASSASSLKGGYMGLKYLTNSRLFHLQLRDPSVRLQVLTQVCIIANYARMLCGKDAPEKPGVSELIKQAKKLMKATPGGREYASMLDTVLYREHRWFDWKANKCEPKIERPADVETKKLAEDPEVKASFAKAMAPTAVVKAQQRGFFGGQLILPPPVDLSAIMQGVGDENKTFDNYIRVKYEEAEDPESGIEAAYHPKHDFIFNQRAVRLAARAKEVRGFEDLEEANVTAVLDEYAYILRKQATKQAEAAALASNGSPEPSAMEVEPDPSTSTNGVAPKRQKT